MHALAEWLARAEPDPLGIQYTALLKACTELCNLKGIAAEKLYVWLECVLLPHCTIALWYPHLTRVDRMRSWCCVCSYLSIPQVNNSLKQLAINSLAVLSASCRYFIILAPDGTHADTLKACNVESYNRRGWCTHPKRGTPAKSKRPMSSGRRSG